MQNLSAWAAEILQRWVSLPRRKCRYAAWMNLTATLHSGPLDGKEVPILARPTDEIADDWPTDIVLKHGDHLLDYRKREGWTGDYDFVRYLPRDGGMG